MKAGMSSSANGVTPAQEPPKRPKPRMTTAQRTTARASSYPMMPFTHFQNLVSLRNATETIFACGLAPCGRCGAQQRIQKSSAVIRIPLAIAGARLVRSVGKQFRSVLGSVSLPDTAIPVPFVSGYS